MTKYKAGWASKQYLNMIKKHATDTDAEVFVIKYSTVVANAQANNQHIFVEEPKSNPTIENKATAIPLALDGGLR